MKLLVTGAWRHTNNQLNQLMQLGHEVVFMQNEKDPVPCSYESIEGVICNGLFIYHPIDRFESLRYVQLTSAGFDRAPMEYIKSRGITIHNAGGVYSIPIAEYVLAAVLSVYKQAEHFRLSQQSHLWAKHRGLREMYGKRVCIVGCGSVGNECAIRFAAMGCEVVGIDAFPTPHSAYSDVLPVCALMEAVQASDVVVLALPLTKETRGMVNRKLLEALPAGAIIVNVSRGAVVDTEELIEVLRERPDITAILDVFDTEPLLAEDPLWEMENVIITPHNSFVGEGNADRLWSVILNNLQNFTEN